MIITIKDLKVVLSGKKILDFEGNRIQIEQGDKLAIVGENGAGKTTLINTLLGELKVSSGQIEREFKPDEVGIVFQENNYSDLIKVNELIRLIYPQWKQQDTNVFLDTYDLNNLARSYVKDLSTGELQRLTLGLTLKQQKKIYFFDEITSGLDAIKRGQLLHVMRSETKNATVVNISHYFEEIDGWATKLLIIDHGKILFFGSKSELLSKYPHTAAIKINNLDTQTPEKLGTIINSGDGVIYIVKSNEQKAELSLWLNQYNISSVTIEPNIYTCYLQALREEGGANAEAIS